MYFLKLGADRNIRDRQGRTALNIASRLEDSSDRFFLSHMLKNFHHKNAPTSQPANDPMPWTLEYSVMHGQLEATKMLLRMKADSKAIGIKGADINARTRDEGQTPLHIAATMGKMKSIETFVALGADQTIKDTKQLTSLEAAEKVGLTNVVTYLKRPIRVQ